MDMKLSEDKSSYPVVCRRENTARVFEAGGRKWDVEKAEDLLIRRTRRWWSRDPTRLSPQLLPREQQKPTMNVRQRRKKRLRNGVMKLKQSLLATKTQS